MPILSVLNLKISKYMYMNKRIKKNSVVFLTCIQNFIVIKLYILLGRLPHVTKTNKQTSYFIFKLYSILCKFKLQNFLMYSIFARFLPGKC